MIRLPIVFFIVAGVAFATAAVPLAPRGIDAEAQLAVQDNPEALADRALDRVFNAELATREIEAALTADDADLAKSFLDLAQERGVPLAPELVKRVEEANSAAAAAMRAAGSFAKGLITGEPDDVVGLAGTAIGDLFVFGDIRDAVREGSRWANGEQADELVLGLACVGLAITAGTYATFGAGSPARIGVSLVKAARKTGRLSVQMGEWLSRTLRQVIDWNALKRAFGNVALAEPAVAVRAARQAVRADRAEELIKVATNIGRVQTRAGTQAALDGLRIAQGPADVARIARLADKKGGKTRAILKTLGRGAIALTLGTFHLAMWLFWAILTLFGLVSSMKAAVERATQRHLERKKERRKREEFQEIEAALRARA